MNEADKVWIRLIEGVETLVKVDAKPLKDGSYEIIENRYLDLANDATSIWEFFPTDVVKCEVRGDQTVATQLISSKFPKRKLYGLIFLIVQGLGNVSLDQLVGFEDEIKLLCTNSTIRQQNHPIVKQWILKNKKQINPFTSS